MLSPAKADLEVQRTVAPEQALSSHRPVGRHRYLRQEIVDQRLLARAQRLAMAPAIKPLERGRVALLERGHPARIPVWLHPVQIHSILGSSTDRTRTL